MRYREFIKNLFPFVRQHIGKLLITSLLMILATVLESSIPEITGQIVDKLFNNGRSLNQTLLYSFLIFGVISLSALFSLISLSTGSWVANKVVMDIRILMFEKLLTLPKKYFDENASGKILSKLTFDVEQIASASSRIWLDFIKAAITVLILFFYLVYKNWELSLSLLVILPIIFFAVRKSSIVIRESSKRVQRSIGDLTHLLDENIDGNQIIKIYQAQKYEKFKFNKLVKTIRQQRSKVDLSAATNSNLINILLGISLGLVVYLSSHAFNMTAGEFLSFFTALAMLIKPSKTLVNINKPFQIAVAAGESVFSFLNEVDEVDTGKKNSARFKGQILFENVYFEYNNNLPILSGISFEIQSGQTLAIVGPTGSGKSTIVDLLSKFYTPKSGSIKVDGIDLKNIDNDSLRRNISYVDQETRLFNDTIRSNISLGSSEMKSALIERAAHKANAYDFIENLENQFDTQIGDNGQLLSGGQRQRIAIARAIAKNAPILILDEATSSLDSSTEKLIQESLSKISKHTTTIVIAHRLSTVQNADKIIVLSKGTIIEEGNHEELIKKQGFYSKLVEDQFD